MAAESSVVKNFRDGTLTLADGTGTPVTYTVVLEAGDFSVSLMSADNHEVNAYLDRGDFATLRKTNQTFPSWSFTAHQTGVSDATLQTIYDFVMKANAYSGNTSTLGANADVYTIKVTLTIEGTDHGDAADHTLVFDDSHVTIDFSEGDPNTWSLSGTSYAAPTST